MKKLSGLMKCIGIAGCFSFLLFPAALHSQDAPKEKIALMLNWYLYSEHAPFFLGKEKGFFAEEGIDLEIQEGRGSAATAQAVAARSVPFGYIDVATMIKAAAKGAPLKSTGVLFQRSPIAVIAFADKNIKTPQDIIGKTIGVTPGDAPSQMWPLFLKANNIQPDQVKTVSGDTQTKLNAVINGQADMLIGYVMDQAIKLQDATGKPTHSVLFSDSNVNQISSGIVVSTALLNENPDLVKRFMRAATRSAEAAISDPASAVDAMLKANPKSGTRDTLIYGLQQSIALYHTDDTKGQRPFRVTMHNVENTLDLLVNVGGMDPATRGKPEDYVTLDYLPN